MERSRTLGVTVGFAVLMALGAACSRDADAPQPDPRPEVAPPQEAGDKGEVLIPTEEPQGAAPATLLSFVPRGHGFLALRDAVSIVEFSASALPVVERLAAVGEKTGKSKGDELARAQRILKALPGVLEKEGVHPERGLLIVGQDGGDDDGVFVHGADRPDAAIAVLDALEIKHPPLHCRAVSEGYSACSASAEALAAYTVGSDGAGIVKAVKDALPGTAVDRAVAFAGYHGGGDEGGVYGAIVPGPGRLDASFGMHLPTGPAREEALAVLSSLRPGGGSLLGFAGAGAGFLWWNFDPDALARSADGVDADAEARAALAAWSGEVFVGTTNRGGASFTIRVGLKNSAEVRAQLDAALGPVFAGYEANAKKDGDAAREVELSRRALNHNGAQTTAYHLDLTRSGDPNDEVRKIHDATGLWPTAWLAVTETALVFSIGPQWHDLGRVLWPESTIPRDQLAREFPGELGADLMDDRVSNITHLTFDGLQAPALRELLAKEQKEDPTLGGLQALLDVIAPLSSVTSWTSHRGDLPTLHATIRLVGAQSDTSPEGVAAREVVEAVIAGGDPSVTYGNLLAKFPDSTRAAAYRVRAGQDRSPSMFVGALATMATAFIAVPALMFGGALDVNDEPEPSGVVPPPAPVTPPQ